MADNTMTNRIKDRILAAYQKRREQVEVSVTELASAVFDELDPVGQTPMLARHCAVLQVRQMTREILRAKVEKETDDQNEVVDLFGWALQKRYPVERNGAPFYVELENLSEDEALANAESLDSESDQKKAHARALRAYVAWKKARGGFLAVGT